MEGSVQFFCNYFEKIKEEEAEEKYQTRIIQEIAKLKEVECRINKKLAWFASLDETHAQKLWYLEQLVGRQEYPWPKKIDSVQITNGFFPLLCDRDVYGRKVPLHVEPDRKRCQKRLTKKGALDVEYLEQVQEKHMTSKKSSGMTSSGTRELNYLVESMRHRIQHGNFTRAHEMKTYQEIKHVNETRELYSAPEPPSRYSQYKPSLKENNVKGDRDQKLSKQHRIRVCLFDIDNVTRHLKERKSKVFRLKENLELVRKNIAYLQKELENDTSKKNLTHGSKRADKFEVSIYAEKLARKGIEGLKRLCLHDTEVEIFVRHWCYFKGFKDDYETYELAFWKTMRWELRDDYDTKKLALKRP